jgi:archaellum biogenesis ATPase FlaH
VADEYSWGEDFQLKVLALYVKEPQTCHDFIEPSYFSNPMHMDIARLVKELYVKHSKKEVRLSRGSLNAIVRGFLGKRRRDLWGGYRKVIKLVFAEELTDQPVVISQALEFAKEQRFRGALVSAEKYINTHNFEAAVKEFDVLKGFGAERDLGVEYWKNPDDPSRWLEDRQGLVRTFYLPTLDYRMGGGLGAGELGIILAAGKAGKTTLLGRFGGGALWQAKNVAIATGELSAEKYRKRIDGMITGFTSNELTRVGQAANAPSQTKATRERLLDLQERMRQAQHQMKGRLWIKQWPTNKGKIRDIETWLNQLEDKISEKIDILFVDYIRVFKPNTRFEEHRISIGEIALDLRGLAVERKIPVWTAQQANRAALKKERLEPSDIAEDISSFWTLDFLLALCQTEQERGTEKDREAGRPEKARLYLASARDVSQGYTIDLLINRNTFVVREKKRKKL